MQNPTIAVIVESVEAAREAVAVNPAASLAFLWHALDKPTKARVNSQFRRMGMSIPGGEGDAAMSRFVGFLHLCMWGSPSNVPIKANSWHYDTRREFPILDRYPNLNLVDDKSGNAWKHIEIEEDAPFVLTSRKPAPVQGRMF